MSKEWIVYVTYIGEKDYEDIEEDDHLSEGDYYYTGDDEDEALDKFHEDHPCSHPELYEITVNEDIEED